MFGGFAAAPRCMQNAARRAMGIVTAVVRRTALARA